MGGFARWSLIARPVFGARRDIDGATQRVTGRHIVCPVKLLFANLIIPSNSNPVKAPVAPPLEY